MVGRVGMRPELIGWALDRAAQVPRTMGSLDAYD